MYKTYKSLKSNTYNSKSLKIAILACVHGNEKIGLKVFKKLREIKIKDGKVDLIIANPKAMMKGKRFIERDLNRSFPGNHDGVYEEKLAFSLREKLKDYDYVIDIHGADAHVEALLVVTSLKKSVRTFIKEVPISKIAYIGNSTYGKVGLISYCKCGVSLEYGPTKEGGNFQKAVVDINNILANLGVLNGKGMYVAKRDLFTVKESYRFKKPFKALSNIKDFNLINKGEPIGTINGRPLRAKRTFYPVMVSRKTKEYFALMSTKSELII